jgi:hypothetical protein
MITEQLNDQTAVSRHFLTQQHPRFGQACAPGAWGPGLPGLGATRGSVGHPCMGVGWCLAAPPPFAARSPAPALAGDHIILHHGVHSGCPTQNFNGEASTAHATSRLGTDNLEPPPA